MKIHLKKLMLTAFTFITSTSLMAQIEKPPSRNEIQVKEVVAEPVKAERYEQMADNHGLPIGYEWVYDNVNKNIKGVKQISTDKIILEPQYQIIYKLIDDYYNVNNKLYNITEQKFVYEEEANNLSQFYHSNSSNVYYFTRAKKNGTTEIINHLGELVSKNNEENFELIHDGYVYTNKNSIKKGLHFFSKNKKNIDTLYNEIYLYNVIIVCKNENRYQLFDTNGKAIYKNITSLVRYSDNWLRERMKHHTLTNNKNKMALLDMRSQNLIIPFKYNKIVDNWQEKYTVIKDNKWGIIENNKIILPLKFDSIYYLKPNTKNDIFLSIAKNKKFALYNQNNYTQLTDYIYDEIESINNNFFKVKTSKGYAVINNLGKQVTNTYYDHIGEYYGETCSVFKNDKIDYLNAKGEQIGNFENDSQAKGYTTIKQLLNAFMDAMYSNDDEKFRELATNIMPDKNTQHAMERIPYSYRGFPNKTNADNPKLQEGISKETADYISERNELKRILDLSTFELDESKNNYRPSYFEGNILGAESTYFIKLKKGEIEYRIGELLYIDGFWKSFTGARVDYHKK